MTDTQREEFEAQMVQQGRIRPFLRDPEGDYTDMRMYWAWRGFQAAQAADAGREEQPNLTNPLTPYGMLVRALRIVANTTLLDMAEALLTTPAKLSSMEFGRTEVTPEFTFDVVAYFDALGVTSTHAALMAAILDASAAQKDTHDCGCETNQACAMKTDGSCWRAD